MSFLIALGELIHAMFTEKIEAMQMRNTPAEGSQAAMSAQLEQNVTVAVSPTALDESPKLSDRIVAADEASLTSEQLAYLEADVR